MYKRQVVILIATHVDDVIWASEPEFETIVQEMQRVLQFGALEEYTFRFCGVERKQDMETFAVAITCSTTSEKLTQARLSKERSNQLADALNDAENEQFQSMVGSLMWICRCCRTRIGYTASTLLAAIKKPNVEDMLKCNKCVR